MITFPNAKINIGLNVLSRRADGYHEISTVMVPVEWCDVLEIVPSTKNRYVFSGNAMDCPPEKNLVVKALRAVERQAGRKLDCDIFLRKEIPDGAGLGGGSSDASSTIRMLNDIYELDLSTSMMIDIASGIGADCPFFILNRPVLATGIGEIMTPVEIDLEGRRLVIVKPPESISTAMAYGGVTPRIPDVNLLEAVKRPIAEWRELITNDFEEVVFSYHPYMRTIKDSLYDNGALYASMSGSGSAFYGIFERDTDNLAELTRYFRDKGYKTHESIMKFERN